MTHTLQSQVVIRDTVRLSPIRSQSLSSLTSTILTATFTYYSDALGATFQVDGPCGFHQVSENGGEGFICNGCQGASVQMVLNFVDPGAYTFTVNYHPCTYQHSCSEYHESISVVDNHGNHWLSLGYYSASVTASVTSGCDSALNQPQRFDTTNFEVYSEGSTFSWVDLSGVTQARTVEECNYNPESEDISGRLGFTIPLVSVPLTNPQSPSYRLTHLFQTMVATPEICLDLTNPNDPRWNISYNGHLRIPLFASTCPRPGFTDIGDDSAQWALHILDCSTYHKAHEAMIYWRNGSYGNGPVPGGIYSNGTIMAHESTHVRELKRGIKLAIDAAFDSIYEHKPSGLTYVCRTDLTPIIQDYGAVIWHNFINSVKAPTVKPPWAEVLRRETRVDQDPDTQTRRDSILAAFKRWGKSRGWDTGCP